MGRQLFYLSSVPFYDVNRYRTVFGLETCSNLNVVRGRRTLYWSSRALNWPFGGDKSRDGGSVSSHQAGLFVGSSLDIPTAASI